MSKLVFVVIFCAGVCYGKNCTFERQENHPLGTLDEQMFESFDYTLSATKQKMYLNNIQPTKEGNSYADPAAGETWPTDDTGTLNKNYSPKSENHKGFRQYKGFKGINANVRWNNFQILIKGNVARIPIKTNDGLYSEEVFSCQ